MYVYHIFFIQSSADGHLGCFPISEDWCIKYSGQLYEGCDVTPILQISAWRNTFPAWHHVGNRIWVSPGCARHLCGNWSPADLGSNPSLKAFTCCYKCRYLFCVSWTGSHYRTVLRQGELMDNKHSASCFTGSHLFPHLIYPFPIQWKVWKRGDISLWFLSISFHSPVLLSMHFL